MAGVAMEEEGVTEAAVSSINASFEGVSVWMWATDERCQWLYKIKEGRGGKLEM